MTAGFGRAEAFLVQAISDFAVYELLLSQNLHEYPVCHALQHLQMATEKLSKSMILTIDPGAEMMSHIAFRRIKPILERPSVAQKLGFAGNMRNYRSLLRALPKWVSKVEQLNPSVGTDTESAGPNVEYPWQARDEFGSMVWYAPVRYQFELGVTVRSKEDIQFINLIRSLLERLPDAILP